MVRKQGVEIVQTEPFRHKVVLYRYSYEGEGRLLQRIWGIGRLYIAGRLPKPADTTARPSHWLALGYMGLFHAASAFRASLSDRCHESLQEE